jgi:DNA-binding CsgD family transcriptional regulator
MSTPKAVASFVAADFTGSRRALPIIDALTASDAPPRVFISGNAGSGKSTVLRNAQQCLSHQHVPVQALRPDTDVAAVPASSVLLVDDLNLLSGIQLADIRERAADPDAGLIAASRPWPRPPDVSTIARHLERSRPAVVLGHVTRSDALEFLSNSGVDVAPECLDHILTVTGGFAWLVSVALVAHDARDCGDGGDHTALDGVLQQHVAHRLSVLDDSLRRVIETASVISIGDGLLDTDLPLFSEAALAAGYAEGLLLRNGQVIPVVQDSVRAGLSAQRLTDLLTHVNPAMIPDTQAAQASDRRFGEVLAERGDQALSVAPQRARDLYTAAAQAGYSPPGFAARRARAAWVCGDIDEAAQRIDEALSGVARSIDTDLAEVAAATWSIRGMLRTGRAFYDALPKTSGEVSVGEFVTRLGVGDRSGADSAMPAGAHPSTPSTLAVSLDLLRRGLQATLNPANAVAGIADLVHASHLYSASGSSAPLPESPAVIAAVAALCAGDTGTARAVVDAAVDAEVNNGFLRSRLLLWRAWIALAEARGAQAREALNEAHELTPRFAPRDTLIANAIRIGLASRYEDTAALAAAWQEGRSSLIDVEIDLFTLLPFTEFVSAGARLNDEGATRELFACAVQLVKSLGSPPLWSAHLYWAGIQQAILLKRPDALAPHAHALVVAAPVSEVASTMAGAGKLWTSVMSGAVDADAVESAARALATIGLKWDAARLAGHGASRSDDRKVAARLLAQARELHPPEKNRASAMPATGEQSAPNPDAPESLLSERETDVARLVVEGKTYAEIGATIFISPRTAEHHIASIRRRLGATSRSDLIAKLRLALREGSPPESGKR